jgi:hypothetical protein
MASKIFTAGIMVDASATVSTGTEATKHDIEYALDSNPNTNWEPSNTDNQTIDIDLGSAQTVDQIALIIKDYDTDYSGGTFAVSLAYDDNDNGSYSAVTIVAQSATGAGHTQGDPIWLFDSTVTQATKRYWRLRLFNNNVVPKLSMILLLREREIAIGETLPSQDGRIYHADLVFNMGGMAWAQGGSNTIQRSFTRNYKLPAANLMALQNAVDDCYGGRHLCILQEGSNNYLCRIVLPASPTGGVELAVVQEAYQFYSVDVPFVEIVGIDDGATL